MKIIINEDNLKNDEVNEFSSKVRCILINQNNQILVCNYGGTYLLPGGKIDGCEDNIDALIRELNEETGVLYNRNDFNPFCELQYFQKDYPKRDSDIKINRLVTTFYYLGTYREINLDKQILSDKEIKSNFKLELIDINELENIILNNHNSNPRNIFFQKELLMIFNKFKNTKENVFVLKK